MAPSLARQHAANKTGQASNGALFGSGAEVTWCSKKEYDGTCRR